MPTTRFANRAHFVRRRHNTVEPRLFSQESSADGSRFRSTRDAHRFERRCIQARQHRDAEQFPVSFAARRCRERVSSRPHHRAASSRVHVYQSDVGQCRSRRDGARHSVGNVVIFQVQKDARTQSSHLADRIGSTGGKQVNVDFEKARKISKTSRSAHCLVNAAEIQCED
jgi:hypothetical protein